MNIQKTLQKTINLFNKTKIPSAALSAELLLSYVLKKPRSYLYIWPERKLTKKQEKSFKQLVKRRQKFEPVAYLTKNKEFFSLNFYVDKNVPVPRPETESLVEEIITQIKKRPGKKSLTVADIGTGSGCIAVSLKKYLPKLKVFASDISEKALRVAAKNAKKNKVKIYFKKGSLLEPYNNIMLDVVVANLPYLRPAQIKNKTIQAEPKSAFLGGKDGLDYYRELINQIKKFKKKKTWVFLEIDPRQTTAARKLMRSEFPIREKWIGKDLFGQNRIVVIK